jgi:hypothetical protein
MCSETKHTRFYKDICLNFNKKMEVVVKGTYFEYLLKCRGAKFNEFDDVEVFTISFY